MAQPIPCDVDGCTNLAEIIATLLQTGDTSGVCGEHIPTWCAMLLDGFGLMVMPKQTDPETDEETDEDQAAPKGAARPRKRRHVAVVRERERSTVETEARDTPAAG